MGDTLLASQDRPERAVVDRAVETLRSGGVVVLPTDSVYGICCAATPGNPAHERIFEIKRRDRAQTLPWFVRGPEDLARYGEHVAPWALRLAERCWPGALTIVVRASAAVPPEYAQAGPSGPTIALRAPGSALDLAVVRALGAPLAQTSANTHGAPAATTGSAVEAGIASAVDLVVDAGPAPVGVASTIVDATGESPVVLRVGAMSEAEVLLAARP